MNKNRTSYYSNAFHCRFILIFTSFFKKFQTVSISINWTGINICFILQIDVTEELEKLYNHKPRDAAKKRMPRTFKLKRAQMNHLQTLREISEQQQQQRRENPTGPMPGTSTEKP